MITVYIPPNDPLSCFEDNRIVNGLGAVKLHYARMHGGRRVIDLTPQALKSMIAGNNGLSWERENQAAIEWLHANRLNPDVDAFPGEHRAPLVQA